ncbi:hypothetical protein BU25DRAFT_420923 [Macroventuria anomochaeta]|uniref:Uncharacterized protein n=1 Tax=Macroventuria anomochaeta TaxID=301207 RepID=A0ACB6S4K5_9PLEO|nr:uncharacterized protein BU25DRAFT_420923 [Macroventuria anomochaeta]KAF2628452.1 hypothetical protein BU25DRAFT_420923 [Macroventuria anomochaeta]
MSATSTLSNINTSTRQPRSHTINRKTGETRQPANDGLVGPTVTSKKPQKSLIAFLTVLPYTFTVIADERRLAQIVIGFSNLVLRHTATSSPAHLDINLNTASHDDHGTTNMSAHTERPAADLSDNPTLSDIKIRLISGGEVVREYHAHNIALCRRTDTLQDVKDPIMNLLDDNPNHSEVLLKYVYNGDNYYEDVKQLCNGDSTKQVLTAMGVWALADKYGLKFFSKEVECHIDGILSEANEDFTTLEAAINEYYSCKPAVDSKLGKMKKMTCAYSIFAADMMLVWERKQRPRTTVIRIGWSIQGLTVPLAEFPGLPLQHHAFSDVTTLQFDTDEELHEYRAHKAVLCMQSDFFRHELTGDYEDRDDIKLVRHDKLHFELLPKYTYTNHYDKAEIARLAVKDMTQRVLIPIGIGVVADKYPVPTIYQRASCDMHTVLWTGDTGNFKFLRAAIIAHYGESVDMDTPMEKPITSVILEGQRKFTDSATYETTLKTFPTFAIGMALALDRDTINVYCGSCSVGLTVRTDARDKMNKTWFCCNFCKSPSTVVQTKA